MNTNRDVLDACPFCGCDQDNSGQYPFPTGRDRKWWVARCGNPGCGAEIEHGSRDAVITAWNRRTPPPSGDGLPELVEEGLTYFDKAGDAGDKQYATAIRAHLGLLQSAQVGGVPFDELMTLIDSYADGPHTEGYYGARRQAVVDALRRLAQPQREGVAAYVPIHPRNGPLWSDTLPANSSIERQNNYPLLALYTQQPASAAVGVCPHWWDVTALEVATRFTQDTEPQRRASLQCAVRDAMAMVAGNLESE